MSAARWIAGRLRWLLVHEPVAAHRLVVVVVGVLAGWGLDVDPDTLLGVLAALLAVETVVTRAAVWPSAHVTDVARHAIKAVEPDMSVVDVDRDTSTDGVR